MPIDRHSSRIALSPPMGKLVAGRDDIVASKIQLRQTINDALEELLDTELHAFHTESQATSQKSALSNGISQFSAWIRGVYYLTLARVTNPLAYKMAWRVIEKLDQQQQ